MSKRVQDEKHPGLAFNLIGKLLISENLWVSGVISCGGLIFSW